MQLQAYCKSLASCCCLPSDEPEEKDVESETLISRKVRNSRDGDSCSHAKYLQKARKVSMAKIVDIPSSPSRDEILWPTPLRFFFPACVSAVVDVLLRFFDMLKWPRWSSESPLASRSPSP